MAVSPKLRAQILARSPVCRICRKAPATTVDHIWPRRYGGTDDPGNLQAACRPCNSRKNGRTPPVGMLPLYGQLEPVERVRRGLTPHAIRCSIAWHTRHRAS